MGSLLHGFLSGSIRFLSVVPKNLYHKIDLSPNPVFLRWRAYLKKWSAFPSLSPSISERTAHCRKNLHDNKTLNKPFCFPLCKTTSGKKENFLPHSVKMYAKQSLRCLQTSHRGQICSPQTANPSQTKVCFPLIKGQKPLIIYTHTKHNLNICSCLCFYFTI